MKNKIIYFINFMWTSLIAYSFSFCFGWIYLDITGHSKGYGYDLGADKDISIIFGCIELLIWLAITLPSIIYVIRKTSSKGKVYLLILIAFYIVLAVIGLFMMFENWAAYLKGIFNI